MGHRHLMVKAGSRSPYTSCRLGSGGGHEGVSRGSVGGQDGPPPLDGEGGQPLPVHLLQVGVTRGSGGGQEGVMRGSEGGQEGV
eukprot:64139-Prorocentrum_minimum.AAC.1